MNTVLSDTVVFQLVVHAFDDLDAQRLRVDLRLPRYVTFTVPVLSSTCSAAISPMACASSLQTSQHKWRVGHEPSWFLYRITPISRSVLAEVWLCGINSFLAQDPLYAFLIP